MLPVDQQVISDKYSESRWVVIRQLLSREQSQACVADAPWLASRRVCHRYRGRREWRTEHEINPNSLLVSLLKSDALFEIAQAVSSQRLSRVPTIWGQTYHFGERSPWHRDVGKVQLVVCLKTVAGGRKGQIRLKLEDGVMPVGLDVGDALLFDAAGIEHATTRIRSVTKKESADRTTASIRYNLADYWTSV